MNARVPWNCTGQQRKAMMVEIAKQEKAMIEASEKNIDVAVLYALHHLCGFGQKRLRRFFEGFNQIYAELVERYEAETDLPWIYDRKLKEIGVDVDAWREEEKKQERES